MQQYDELVAAIDNRLTESRFTIWRNISVVDETETNIFATRIEWRFFRFTEHVLLQYKDNPSRKDFEELYESGINYARRAYSVAPPIQFFMGTYALIVCIAAQTVDPVTIEYVTNKPQIFWKKKLLHGFCQLPVLLDLGSRSIHYFRGNASVGLPTYRIAQGIVQRCLDFPGA